MAGLIRHRRSPSTKSPCCLSASRIFMGSALRIRKSHLRFCAWSEHACDGWLALSKNSHSPLSVIGSPPPPFVSPPKKRRGREEGIEIILTVSNQDLASQIGTVRELVSRNLSRLQADGIIKIDGRRMVVRSLPGLEAETRSTD